MALVLYLIWDLKEMGYTKKVPVSWDRKYKIKFIKPKGVMIVYV